MTPAATVVLGAHCDDIAFSLAGALLHGLFGEIVPVTVFSVSNYTWTGEGDATEITRRRKEEDLSFFAPLAGVRPPVWLDRLGAPLRLGIGAAAVVRDPEPKDDLEIEALVAQVDSLADKETAMVAPLALGGHVDHIVVRESALRLALAGRPLLLYEDLPYAAELTREDIDRVVEGVGLFLGCRMEPLLLGVPHLQAAKERALRCYRSQAKPGFLEKIMDYSRRLGRGAEPVERVWRIQGVDKPVFKADPNVQVQGV